MTKHEDHLSNEVSASVRYTGVGITGGVKSRLISSIDRLGGAIFDVGSAFIEKQISKIRNGNNAGEESPDSTPDRKIESAIQERELRKLHNKVRIVENAIEELKSSDEETDNSEEPIKEDWLNKFESEAENASSEDLRALWAKVLAGEIRKPGSFSLRTLRFLSEVDSKTAQSFEKFVQFRQSGEIVLKDRDYKNKELFEITELEEAGLIIEGNGTLTNTYTLNENSEYGVRFGDLFVNIDAEKGTKEIMYPIIKISRVGQEICQLLPKQDQLATIRHFANYLLDNKLATKIVAGPITHQDEAEVLFKKILILPEEK